MNITCASNVETAYCSAEGVAVARRLRWRAKRATLDVANLFAETLATLSELPSRCLAPRSRPETDAAPRRIADVGNASADIGRRTRARGPRGKV